MSTNAPKIILFVNGEALQPNSSRVDVSKDQTFRGNGQIFYFAYIYKFVMPIGPVNHGVLNLFKSFSFSKKSQKSFLPLKCI